ncbi:MAG: ribonuclease HII [Bacteroidales bacterium]|nr:ribonuclease HII [Bacteroidales bacterium]MBR6438763.1 ribonuclease HII [Bacteroidales bacterium]
MNLKPFFTENLIEAGCDEAGRGCIAGPVVAAAVILPRGMDFPEFDDSKKLSEKQREKLRVKVLENAAAYGVGIVSAEEIDEINILNASFLAMHRAIDQLKIRPELLLIDGNRFNKYHDIKHQCIVGGDAKYQAIAAASILAKTTRDHIMEELDIQYPAYNWKQNKGYPTIEHKNAVAEHGMSPYHRKTFNMSIQLKLF